MSLYEDFMKRHKEMEKKYIEAERKRSFYADLMSNPNYSVKKKHKDEYEGGDYEPEGSFSWDYYYNDDGE